MARLLAVVLGVALLQAPAVRVQSIDGGPATLDPFAAPEGTRAIVFLLTSTECRGSNRCAPEVRRLAQGSARQGGFFRGVYRGPAESTAAIRPHMAGFAYAGA